MLRRQHQERRAIQRIGAGGKDLDRGLRITHLEINFRALGFADPVALHVLQGFRPIQAIEPLQQAIGIRGNSQHPLLHYLFLNRVATPLGETVLDFVVGQHRAQGRAPVHIRVGAIRQSVVHQELRLLQRRESGPLLRADGCGPRIRPGIHPGIAGLFKTLDQGIDRLGLVGIEAEPTVEQLGEYPLRPVIVLSIGSLDLAVRVITETQFSQLRLERGNVLVSGHSWVLSGFDCILFRGQSERVETHGMQNIETSHSFKTTIYISRNISARMPNMQTGTRRIRKHVKAIIFRQRSI